MTIYLVRHAKAGSRSGWDGRDEDRPLSKSGRQQSDLLTKALASCGVTRILTSPYLRCVQTVEPLAAAVGGAVELCDALAEGAPRAEAVELFDKYAAEPTVLCSHGDVIGELLDECRRRGADLGEGRQEKGSTWVIEADEARIIEARYLPPPT